MLEHLDIPRMEQHPCWHVSASATGGEHAARAGQLEELELVSTADVVWSLCPHGPDRTGIAHTRPVSMSIVND